MLGVDSNILVRFFARDEKEQFDIASRFLDSAEDKSLYLSVVVLVELNWVLQRSYKHPRTNVLDTLDSLMDARQFVIEERQRVIAAIDIALSTGCDFSDALIALGNEAYGCDRTVTFDRDALRIKQMVAVDARQ